MAHYFTNEPNLKSDIKKVNSIINNINFYFYTDNGVFSKGELDFGTELLLKTFKYNCYPQGKKALDIGCGCGPIGIYLSKLNFTVDMSDVNIRALNLTRKAVDEQILSANIIESDGYQNINSKYNYILSNPPIKAGKKVLYDIVIGSKDYLELDGELWIVIRKDKGADSLARDMKEHFSKVEVIAKKKGFNIIKAIK